ncbi:alpha-1,2-fucosyltransferase [Ensifer sp. LC163]|uniref:alpha-1,2-fucosyltransferase n=1 Tax=Ensifer sp. LC163 TaxID=1120652 RepID=UPI000813D25B|nr:alpha-1,2-fucosyltransferase [Ensifer sp. LC163]OCP36447.1 hypothetical protein BC360_24270 [Ensifer sp. LC163]
MIITRILGGLGNQMFQYAAGRSLASASGQTLKLDLTEMQSYKTWAFGLEQFAIQAESARAEEVPARPGKGLFNKVKSRLLPTAPACIVAKERANTFDATILDLRGPVHLQGYWQTEKYFASVAGVVRQEFQLKAPFSASRHEVLQQVRAADAPISVHVRRGDYVSNPSANAVHGTCEPEWYAEAMRQMAARLDNPSFFVFSDDPAWARANLPSSASMVVVEPQADGKDGEDMHLMAACRAHIIANSTFSWWGAWLNPRADKHVIAPTQWFRSREHDASDILPSTWQRL